MASKRKQKRAVRPSAAPSAPEVGTGMGELLERAGLSSLSPPDEHPQPASQPPPAEDPEPVTMPPPGPRPPSRLPPSPESEPPGSAPEPFTPRSAGDLAAWNEAYRGVRPLQAARRGADRARTVPRPAPPSPADDAAARARLGALVSGDVRFELEHDDGFVRGLREGADETTWKRLEGRGFAPEATLDLHGLGREAARKATVDFIRHKHRGGLRYLLVIVGKGNHSEGGVGVLAQVVASALTGSVAAPLVHGFASAHPRHGGRGALAVQLR